MKKLTLTLILFVGLTTLISGFISNKTILNAQSPATEVLRLATAFKTTLNPDQIAKLETPLNKTSATKWTNIPGGASNRNGLQFSALNPSQLSAAKALIRAASGTAVDEGFDEFIKIGMADDVIGKSGKQGYGSGEYIIAFLGHPSDSETWMLQFGGHHYAQNIVYTKGKTASATPIFEGGDPREWTENGMRYAPLEQEQKAMARMLGAFSEVELAKSRIIEKYGDVMLGTQKDGQFPPTKLGLRVNELKSETKAKVVEAMMPWLNDLDPEMRRRMLEKYSSELSHTYICFSGNQNAEAGKPDTFLKEAGDYVRIDGPGVWIEFCCQPGVYSKQAHYHTVYRDHQLDYNNLWDF